MSYYLEDPEEDEAAQSARDHDRSLTISPPGLHEFSPRPTFGSDPSQIGWPTSLVMDLAMGVDTPKEICRTYGISREDWDSLRVNPGFVGDLRRAMDQIKAEGGSFKARSQLQAGELLKRSWQLIHDPAVPAAVQADLIKSTIKWSGLDASKDQGQAKGGPSLGFAIQINLG